MVSLFSMDFEAKGAYDAWKFGTDARQRDGP